MWILWIMYDSHTKIYDSRFVTVVLTEFGLTFWFNSNFILRFISMRLCYLPFPCMCVSLCTMEYILSMAEQICEKYVKLNCIWWSGVSFLLLNDWWHNLGCSKKLLLPLMWIYKLIKNSHLFSGPLSEVQTAIGINVSLPCELMPNTMVSDDKVTLVLWYKDGEKPIYTWVLFLL